MELEFEEGQAYIHLSDGTNLSVLSEARLEYTRSHPEIQIGLLLGMINPEHAMIHANDVDETFEVALVDDDGECVGAVNSPEWEQYAIRAIGWVAYNYVPRQLIMDLIEKVGVA